MFGQIWRRFCSKKPEPKKLLWQPKKTRRDKVLAKRDALGDFLESFTNEKKEKERKKAKKVYERLVKERAESFPSLPKLEDSFEEWNDRVKDKKIREECEARRKQYSQTEDIEDVKRRVASYLAWKRSCKVLEDLGDIQRNKTEADPPKSKESWKKFIGRESKESVKKFIEDFAEAKLRAEAKFREEERKQFLEQMEAEGSWRIPTEPKYLETWERKIDWEENCTEVSTHYVTEEQDEEKK